MNKKDFWSGLFSGLLIAVFIVCCVLCGRIIYTSTHGGSATLSAETKESSTDREETGTDSESATEKDYDTVLEDPEVQEKVEMLEDTIDQYYIEDVSQDAIENGIYDGIMASLDDPYAAYYTAEEWTEMMNSTEGVYYGIGAYLQKSETTLYPVITGIIADSPAEESELEVDDYIYKVDGTDVYDMDLTEVVSMIKGEEGTTVNLTIVRPSTGEELEIPIERRKVESPTVTYKMLDNDIAYIQITEFDLVTVDQFKEALAEAKGSDMKGLILDLRGNPGGSLSACVDIAEMLLPKGLIVYTEDKYGEKEEYTSDGKHEIDVPMVVLVNGGSASAAEILSGAIKDYGIGTLVGTTTYGKGIVQRLISFNDGSAVKLTVSHYYTPLGNDIHKVGIEPDEVVELDVDAYREDQSDNQLDRAIEIITEQLK